MLVMLTQRMGLAWRWLAWGWLLTVLALVACGGAPAPEAVAPAPRVTQPARPLLNEALDQVMAVATADQWSPFDATPDPDGQNVYFTANGAAGPTVFKVAAAGGTPTVVVSGAPLVAPWGLTISSDGQTLYVADMGRQDSEAGNVIFAVPVSGGAPRPIAETAGTRPNVPQMVREAGVDRLYYTGLADGQPAIFRLDPAQADAPEVIFQGAPLVAPSGVVAAQDGVVYVVDLAAGGDGFGALFRVRAGSAEKIADHLRTNPWLAGVALTLDESVLLVSNLHTEKSTAQVLGVALGTGDLFLIDKGIGDNTNAGGLHRALSVNQFAWSDGPLPVIPHRPPLLNDFSNGGGVYFLTTP